MIIIIISAVLFLILLLLPLIWSSVSLRKENNSLLQVRHDMDRDPRYFAKSFSALMEKALHSYDGSGVIQLSKQEHIIEADNESLPAKCEAVVYAKEKPFHPEADTIFEKEIYSKQDATLIKIPALRAIFCEKNLILGAATQVDRWVDAEGTLVVYDHCNLGISCTSASRLMLGRDCVFRRLYSPVIYLGMDLEKNKNIKEKKSAETADAKRQPLFRNIQYVGETLVQEGNTVVGTIISKHPVIVVDGIILKGHIRSHKAITIQANAVVHGNLFAEGDIHIGRNARVYGNVFTQENLFMEKGSAIGQYGEIKSAIARGEISCDPECRVYGYISTERRGLCAPDPSKYIEALEGETKPDQMPETLAPIGVLPVSKSAVFSTAREFNRMSAQVFRKNPHLEHVVIPEGVTIIRASFFYQCANLKSVLLPSTLLEIQDFAFYGCSSLTKINLSDCTKLQQIGNSAFEGCAVLPGGFAFPSLCQIGSAVFYGCSQLNGMDFSKNTSLQILSSHVFFGCSHLKKLKLPPNLMHVGVSTFYNCTSLTELILPAYVTTIGGYAFWGCKSLKTLEIQSEHIEQQDNILEGIDPNTNIIVKNDAVKKILERMKT